MGACKRNIFRCFADLFLGGPDRLKISGFSVWAMEQLHLLLLRDMQCEDLWK
jgi:hypothetical protein